MGSDCLIRSLFRKVTEVSDSNGHPSLREASLWVPMVIESMGGLFHLDS
jgi:hypothetical protein